LRRSTNFVPVTIVPVPVELEETVAEEVGIEEEDAIEEEETFTGVPEEDEDSP